MFHSSKIKIKSTNRTFNVPIRKVSAIGKFTGLMFRSKKTPNLLFDFSPNTTPSIHSFFVFFPFLAIWLDKKNNVTDSMIVKPFTPIIKPKKQSCRLIELPLNKKNLKITNFFVDKENI